MDGMLKLDESEDMSVFLGEDRSEKSQQRSRKQKRASVRSKGGILQSPANLEPQLRHHVSAAYSFKKWEARLDKEVN